VSGESSVTLAQQGQVFQLHSHTGWDVGSPFWP
jgi:hypothetical protein